MKISLWIEDGREQIVLTGETDTEKQLLKKFKDKSVATIYEGSFYNCQGGWTRGREGNDSLIIVLDHIRATEHQ